MIAKNSMNDEKQTKNPKTYFGDRVVERSQKPELVRGVFENVAQKYDLMNDIMSFGVHRLWKKAMMDWLCPRAEWRMLDVAGGTGDIAFHLLRRAGRGTVTVLDLTADMLEAGRSRAQAKKCGDAINWIAGDAMALPFDDKIFDCYTISFGIRNVTDIETALAQAWRVLKRGGRIMVLEFSDVTIAPLKQIYDLYSRKLIPTLGEIIANDRDSYQYLIESIRRFPNQERFSTMMKQAGFESVEYRNLSGGIVALHSGWKI